MKSIKNGERNACICFLSNVYKKKVFCPVIKIDCTFLYLQLQRAFSYRKVLLLNCNILYFILLNQSPRRI